MAGCLAIALVPLARIRCAIHEIGVDGIKRMPITR
jgi:hypothetical protein